MKPQRDANSYFEFEIFLWILLEITNSQSLGTVTNSREGSECEAESVQWEESNHKHKNCTLEAKIASTY